MYKNFFGFKERPFKLVPNPAYLFLSRSHEEALAHLTYAVIQGEGFMEITGEVGTGKTTLCRAFLEHLDNDTKVAYIFNPNLDAVELLKAINDEFSIPSDADNTKDLIDTLNAFLIEQKTQGKNTILLIDEAQNLTNEVLEQLRLLSNLETAKHKLLHIILVGQPELKEKLDSHELRQLRQRISLSCRLTPLNFKDVRNYIQHRINVASGKPGIQFADAAYRSIYNYSKGIPRLINIVCDRALLTAYGLDQKEITQKIVRASIKELTDRNGINENNFKKQKKAILLFSILSLIIFMVIYFRPGLFRVNTIFNSPETKKLDTLHSNNVKKTFPAVTAPDVKQSVPVVVTPDAKKTVPAVTVTDKKEPVPAVTVSESKKPIPIVTASELKEPIPIVTASESKKIEAQKAKEMEPVIEPITEPARNLGNLLETMNRLSSRHMAIKVALNLWHIEPEIKPNMDTIDDDQDFFRLVSKENNLSIRRIKGNLNAIKKLNLPVILTVHLNKDIPPVYLTLIKIDSQKVTLRGGKQDISIELSPVELESYWSGEAYIPWKNFLSLTGTIPIDSPKDSITTLKMLLRDIGFKEVEINPFYDDKTRQAVKEIQKKYGLHIDGTVGSTTKIALYSEKKVFKQPHIVSVANSFLR
ncbi:MAG: AAA family ATPase [Desulfobacteraceae bacterium]|nr:AAA family ATPase [Desulfobacteraceae bacterium]MDH3723218.1 AAA family ATPase [Desulfobacteraceae bacterium]MDH3836617.1 AAA family ATPase [Desulfobacteraceae bacterium]MDH3872694.1 AAA family ATPase [Desulfobacteraceae bacterium]MDH3880545.1 AAA family ATPase [Desulfobacteraceae bacterium]